MAYTYTPFPGTTIREAIEHAIRMARATGKDVNININDVQFSVNRDTNAINVLIKPHTRITHAIAWKIN